MESSFLLEKRIISMCFNPLRDSVFILSLEGDRLELTEEDLSKNIILRRFKLLKLSECNILNSDYRKLPKDTYEGYGLSFWELPRKILVIYPFGYVMIYDYQTSQLNYHFQCQGKKAYVIRNIIGSPVQKSLFLSAERMRNIYHINYHNLQNGVTYQKLVIPEKETVYDLVCHPNEKFIYAACSDSLIRIFDYSNENAISEVKNGLVDIPIGKDNKPLKNQTDAIKKANILAVITMDINITGTYLLSGNENGYVYLWDALLAIKNRRMLFTKEKFSGSGILSVKFIKTKQFENLSRFICLTKEGKFYICGIVMKDENNLKTYSFNKLYENSTFNPIIYSLNKYNLISSTFINISYFSNIICLKWPSLRMDKLVVNEKREDYLLFTSFNAKYFFIYDNVFPKINFPISTQTKFKDYEDYIPLSNKNNLVFERKIFTVDNFFVYFYDIMTGNIKRMLNYTREFNLKAIYPLKFEVKQQENSTDLHFILLIENENSQKSVLLVLYDTLTNHSKSGQKFEDVIDFVILGEDDQPLTKIFLLHRNRQNAMIYDVVEGKKETRNIEGSIMRVYKTPFCKGHTVLYRNVLSELKFSYNLKSEDVMDYKCINDNNFRLDYSEREIDIAWKKVEGDKFICAISMIEKIVITDENMRLLYSYKIGLVENPNLISSLFWIGKTLFYSKGNCVNYFYGDDNIHQKIFSSDQPNSTIAGILADRYILVSKTSGDGKDINNVNVTTPMLNPVEPILIGYLDSSEIDYNLVKEAVTNMFSNQFSQNLIDKLLKKDLKEVAWVFLSDSKSSFQNIDKKVQILNDLLKFDLCLDNILQNKSLKNEMDFDELAWKFTYDHSMEYIKNTLIGECNILISYGQFEQAFKILELLSDYPKAINLLLIASHKEEYDKLKILLQARGCLSYTDNLLINNVFHIANMKQKADYESSFNSNMRHYSKVFDNYKGEPFSFGANQDKFNLLSIKDAVNKINKKNSHISNLQKKILSFGETPFNQYTQLYNRETSKTELVSICSLVLQRIDQFFGHKNTVYDKNTNAAGNMAKKVDFTDYSVPLSELKDNVDENEEDTSIDQNLEEINENLYLSAYFHCDKGSGTTVEDITENSNEGALLMTHPPVTGNDLQMSQEEQMRNEENYLWSPVLEEFEPLEYEDKWGRKSPGSHSIKFSIQYGTNLRIKHSQSFFHFGKKFTVEFWLKIFNINVSIFSKDALNIDILNGVFITHYQNKIISPIKIMDYQIPYDRWTHVAICYRKKTGKLRIFVNCEELVNFNLNVTEELGLRGDIYFANCNLDGELTEIRIWNQEIPLKFIKENYKSPLPILAENKRKLRMKINKQEENVGGKKKFDFGGSKNAGFGGGRFNFGGANSGGFGNGANSNTTSKAVENTVNFKRGSGMIDDSTTNIPELEKNLNPNASNNLQEFNPGNFNPDMSDVMYPSLGSVLGTSRTNFNANDNEFKFDDANFNQNNFNFNEDTAGGFDFNKDDFNFDK